MPSRLHKITVVICTWNRPQSLQRCLDSLAIQSERNFDVIIRREEGELAAIRNRGLAKVSTDLVSFIDDDTIVPQTWVANVLATYRERPEVVGLTGPAIIPESARANRAVFRHKRLYNLYCKLFLDGGGINRPGHLSSAGAVPYSTDSSSYEGPVEFLEACNMTFRTDMLRIIGGFNESYRDLGEWSEPDACHRISAGGGLLWYSPKVALEHHPCEGGATLRRKQTGTRLANYLLYSRRWVKPCWRHTLYKLFLHLYYLNVEIAACLSTFRR